MSVIEESGDVELSRQAYKEVDMAEEKDIEINGEELLARNDRGVMCSPSHILFVEQM